MNRGRAELGALVGACRAAGVTDLLVLHETRGRPGEPRGMLGKGVGPEGRGWGLWKWVGLGWAGLRGRDWALGAALCWGKGGSEGVVPAGKGAWLM